MGCQADCAPHYCWNHQNQKNNRIKKIFESVCSTVCSLLSFDDNLNNEREKKRDFYIFKLPFLDPADTTAIIEAPLTSSSSSSASW